MPLAPRPPYQLPSYWKAFGHSYIQYSFGTADQTGRLDGLFTSALDIERGVNWANYAVNGAQLIVQGVRQGGYARIFDRLQGMHQVGGPYAPDSGATLLCFGINDIGFTGNTAQIRTAFQHALRSVISRCRMSAYYRSDYQVGVRTTYGAGFTQQTATDYCTGNTTRRASSTTSATITMTLPADYKGEPVSMCFAGTTPNVGGTVTFSGTAGVTGTLITGNIMPSASFSHTAMVKRVTGLTSANAGQTIIATVTALDPSGSVEFDGWWLESNNAGPVIVCNIAKLTATGYAVYGSWTGTEAQKDADVDNFNADLRSVVSEFDSMVQIADLDSALAKDASLFFDGLHANENGAAKCADALLDAQRRFAPTTALGVTANFNPPSPRSASLKQTRVSGRWYTYSRATGAAPAAVVPTVNQSMLAFPFVVTGGRERYNRLLMRTGSTPGGTAGQFRWGLYDDPGWTGYPQCLFEEPTSGAALSTGTAAGINIMSPTSGTGSIAWPLDPGLYWLTFKWTVLPVTLTIQIAPAAPDAWNVMPMLDATPAYVPNPVCWELTAQGAGAFPTVFPTGAVVAQAGTTAALCKPLVALQLA